MGEWLILQENCENKVYVNWQSICDSQWHWWFLDAFHSIFLCSAPHSSVLIVTGITQGHFNTLMILLYLSSINSKFLGLGPWHQGYFKVPRWYQSTAKVENCCARGVSESWQDCVNSVCHRPCWVAADLCHPLRYTLDPVPIRFHSVFWKKDLPRNCMGVLSLNLIVSYCWRLQN